MSDMTIRPVPLTELTADPQNVRQHDDRNLTAIQSSLEAFGQRKPIVCARANDGSLVVIAGNGTLAAARALGWTHLDVAEVPSDWDADKARAYAIADNRTAELANWDDFALANQLIDLEAVGWDMETLGFEPQATDVDAVEETDDVPEPPAEPVTKLGDIWQLGEHRLMCGDSTDQATVARLMAGKKSPLLHADPPYGMGKQSDGVLNDNIYGAKLDAFQMSWWRTCRIHLTDNASAYIWGNAPDLWRLWYVGGLGDSEQVEIRNEIVWDKKDVPGMASPYLTQYPEASERCLFFQLGEQFRGNVNSDSFPNEWQPLLDYMAGEAQAAGLDAAKLKALLGIGMFSHWFTRSQFTLIPERHYKALATEFPGHFVKPWKLLKLEWDAVKSGPTSVVQQSRSYFDNAHDFMRDVWEFSRVHGDERHGHATPKPLDLMARAITSSSSVGAIVLEPFGGSGATLIAAEQTGRICYTMELDPRYCDVIVQRWENLTGQKATRSDG